MLKLKLNINNYKVERRQDRDSENMDDEDF